MKKRIKYIFITILMLMFCSKVDALSYSKNTLTINEGESGTVELYANVGESEVNEIKFTFVYYDDNVTAVFQAVSGYNCTTVKTSHTITFNEGKTGRILLGTITVRDKNSNITSTSAYAYAAIAKKTNGDVINLNNVVLNIKINKVTPTTNNNETTTTTTTTTNVVDNTTTTTAPKSTTTTTTTTTSTTTTKVRENKGLLKEINSKIVKINLEDDVFEYTVNVNENLEELDLLPVANDENTKVDISSQKISELKDKKITITLKNGNDEEKYIININLVPKPTVPEVVIDNEKFVEKNGYKGKWIIAIIFLAGTLVASVLFANSKKK